MKIQVLSIAGLLIAHLASAQVTTVSPTPDHTSNLSSNTWTYGYKTDTLNPFNLFPDYNLVPANTNVHRWFASGVDASLSALFNPTAVDQSWDVFTMPANSMAMHPGPSQQAVLRFTAPAAGTYDFSGSFYDVAVPATAGATSNVYIVTGGATIFSGYVNGTVNPPPAVPFDIMNLALTAGQTVDFQVQNAGAFWGDMVGLQVTAVPEPSTYALISIGILGACLLLKRRLVHPPR